MTILQIILVITHIFMLICGYYVGHDYGRREGMAIGWRRASSVKLSERDK